MTSDVVILIFLAIHIIAAGLMFSQFIAQTAIERFIQRVKGKSAEVAAESVSLAVTQLLGIIGSVGLLISGLVLNYGFRYGILGIGGVYTPMWLATMQVIFVIAMGISGAVVTPNARKALAAMEQALNSGEPLPADAQAFLNRLTLASRLVTLLVVINIFVGIFGMNGVMS